MDKIKLAIIYYSSTGTNYQMAKWAEEAALEAGAQVRLLRVNELAPDVAIDQNPDWRKHDDSTKDVPIAGSEDLEWADAYIFSSPTRFGNMASQMKQFFDMQGGLWARGKLSDKAVSIMTSASNLHGGNEATLLAMYITMMHWGCIIVPPGYSDDSVSRAGGNPYGASVTVDQDGKMIEDVKEAVKYQARRTLDIARRLKK